MPLLKNIVLAVMLGVPFALITSLVMGSWSKALA